MRPLVGARDKEPSGDNGQGRPVGRRCPRRRRAVARVGVRRSARDCSTTEPRRMMFRTCQRHRRGRSSFVVIPLDVEVRSIGDRRSRPATMGPDDHVLHDVGDQVRVAAERGGVADQTKQDLADGIVEMLRDLAYDLRGPSARPRWRRSRASGAPASFCARSSVAGVGNGEGAGTAATGARPALPARPPRTHQCCRAGSEPRGCDGPGSSRPPSSD